MTPRTAPRPFPADEESSWRRIRRYAVPRRTIEESARLRAVGDWAAACAASLVDVAFTPGSVARTYGEGTAAALEDDLRHLVPDLVHWHLPRVLGGRTTLATDRTVLLARYGAGAHLFLTMPMTTKGPQRVTLRVGNAGAAAKARRGRRPQLEDWSAARHLWDARHTHELRERCGGGPERAPFCHPDGTLRTAAELPTADPGPGDSAARTEWITLLHEQGEVEEAFAAVGIDLDAAPQLVHNWYTREPLPLLRRLPLDVAGLGENLRILAARTGGRRWQLRLDWRASLLLEGLGSGSAPTARAVGRDDHPDVPCLPTSLWRRLPDLDLLRAGGVRPRHLHPLVAASLFPALPVADGAFGPPEPETPRPFRVRCRDGAWHRAELRDGRLEIPHTDEERRREQAMRAFGGAVSGCFAAEQAWRSGEGRLPKALRAQRQELFQRVEHGDTAGVTTLLDAGYDLLVRDARGRGLLHVLHLVDHRVLLPRLLKAGLDLESRDKLERTPLASVVEDGGSRAVVEALIDAGARIDVVHVVDLYEPTRLSLAQTVRRFRRTDLAFLAERVRAEHPGIGDEWWDEHADLWDEWRAEHDDEPPQDEHLPEPPPDHHDGELPEHPEEARPPYEDLWPPRGLREPPEDTYEDAPPPEDVNP